MAIISTSNKLDTEQRQHKIVAENFVLLRILEEADKTYKVMTATAGEYNNSYDAFPQQIQLMEAAKAELSSISDSSKTKPDHENRKYVEFYRVDDPREILKAANRIAATLGLDPTSCTWIDADARQEMVDIYEEFATEDDDDAYLSDGMSMTPKGKLTRS